MADLACSITMSSPLEEGVCTDALQLCQVSTVQHSQPRVSCALLSRGTVHRLWVPGDAALQFRMNGNDPGYVSTLAIMRATLDASHNVMIKLPW